MNTLKSEFVIFYLFFQKLEEYLETSSHNILFVYSKDGSILCVVVNLQELKASCFSR